MKRYIRSTRYYVANEDFIPLHAQPEDGYTKLQAIERAQREVDECVRLFGGKPQDYTGDFHILDDNMKYCRDLDSAI
jgi:hypothetical protein